MPNRIPLDPVLPKKMVARGTVHPCLVWQITMMKPVNLPKDSRQAG